MSLSPAEAKVTRNMECTFLIIVCTLLAVNYVQCDHPQVVDFVSKSVENISENVFYLIVDCDDYNLQKTINILEQVQKKVSKSHVNVIVEPFSPKGKQYFKYNLGSVRLRFGQRRVTWVDEL